MVAFYLLALAAGPRASLDGRPTGLARRQGAEADPDALYRQRQDLAAARRAAGIWSARAATGRDFESSWKLARASYWLGTQGTADERRPALEQGVKAGEQAAALEPGRPEGHFWMAANMGALAESFGLRQGLKYRGRIKAELETVLTIDPGWQQGSADRALGRWYFKVPGLFGGSDKKAEEHLRRALGYNPDSTATLVFLAEVLLDDHRRAEARTLLERAIAITPDADWAPEDASFKTQAQALLTKISRH